MVSKSDMKAAFIQTLFDLPVSEVETQSLIEFQNF